MVGCQCHRSTPCCHYDYCCVTAGSLLEPPRHVDGRPEKFVEIGGYDNTRYLSNKTHLLGLPVELRDMIWKYLVQVDHSILMSLRSSENGRRKPTYELSWYMGRTAFRIPEELSSSPWTWPLFSTCRQIFHDARRVHYEVNQFRIYRFRGSDRPEFMTRSPYFYIPESPGMPFDLLYQLILTYEFDFQPAIHNMCHIWGHLVDDAEAVLSRFSKLKSFTFQLFDCPPNFNTFVHTPNEYISSRRAHDSWGPLSAALNASSKEEEKRQVMEVLGTLAQSNGNRNMPPEVRFDYWSKKCTNGEVRDLDLRRLNKYISKS